MNNYNLFESYIFNKITEQQRREFDQRLSADSDFREDFEEHKQVQEALNVLVEQDVSKVISNIKYNTNDNSDTPHASPRDASPRNENIKSIIPKKWLLIAASLLFIIATTFIINSKSSTTTPSMAVADLITLPTGGLRGSDNPKDIYLSKSIEVHALIQNKEWPQAAFILEQIVETTQNKINKDEAEWNLAVIYAQYDKAKALTIIDKILDDPQHGYSDYKKVQPLRESIK